MSGLREVWVVERDDRGAWVPVSVGHQDERAAIADRLNHAANDKTNAQHRVTRYTPASER